MAVFFEGALLPSTGAGRAEALLRTNLETSNSKEGTHRGAAGHSTKHTDSTNRHYHKPTGHNHIPTRRSNKAPNIVTRLRLKANRGTHGLRSRTGGRPSQDEWILETMSGCEVEFMSPPHQRRESAPVQQDKEKSRALDAELEKLVAKEAIEPVDTLSQATFISPMFVVPKSDGSWRPVINLKSLNQHVRARHFKMESIRTAKGLLCSGDWMVKLDLKDAYLSIPMHSSHRQYLAFRWRGRLWMFKTLPFGLNSAPYIFTKLMKPVIAILRRLGIRAILYLDDLLIMAQSREEAKRHLATALELITALGFIINTKKSITDPAQEIEFLGFGGHDHFPTTTEDEVPEESSKATEGPTIGNSQTDSPATRHDGGSPSSHSASTVTLQELGESKDEDHSMGSFLRVSNTSGPDDGNGAPVVDRQSKQPQWQAPTNNTMGLDNRDRCIHNGMGCVQSGDKNGRRMDPGRETVSHQLSRAASCVTCAKVLCIQDEGSQHPPPGRQCDCNCLPQENGRDTLPGAVRPCCEYMELVPTERDCNPRGTSPRKRECQSRLGVTPCEGLKRLDAQERPLQPTGRQVGTVFHRPVCVQDKHTTGDILQLAPGPSSPGSGCLIHPLVRSPCTYVSTIPLITRCLEKLRMEQASAVLIAPVWQN